jgi:hypothetical protein
MRGHGSSPLGWAATVLLAVAYADVLLELAAAVLAITVAVRLMLAAPTRDLLSGRGRRCRLVGRRRCDAVVIDRQPPTAKRGRDHTRS